MRSKIATLVVALVVAALPTAVRAQCSAPVQIAVSTTGTFTNTCNRDPVTNRWNVTVTLNGAVAGNPTVTIRGGSSLLLGRVTIQNNTAIDCRVNILGSDFDQRIGGVGFIDRGTSPDNRVLLLQLATNGDVGYDRPGNAAINVDMIYNISVGGHVLGDMVSNATGRSMGNVFIQGDLAGGITLGPVSSLDSLWVGGAIGRAGSPPVRLRVSGNIGNITAGSINADITTLFNDAAGTVHAIETTMGGFTGSLTCHRLNRVSTAAGEPRFNIAGDLNAGLVITRDIRVPVHVAGGFLNSRMVNGSPVANTIVAGTGAYDDPNVSPLTTMTIEGDFNGAMVLGVPLSAGLASVNRNLVINGALGGTISTAQDIDADITVNGAISGQIVVDGSLRSGRTIRATGPIASSGVVSIGSSMLGTIACPASGLQGQVVINSKNNGGVWGGSVLINEGNPFVGAPAYTNDPAAFGGGAVGLAPFRMNLSACSPRHNTPGAAGLAAESAFTNPANTPVLCRFYGPVQCPPGWTPNQAVVVERLVGGSWVDRTSDFLVSLVPAGSSSSRVIGLSRAAGSMTNPAVGNYRLRPVSLLNAGVLGAPPVVFTEAYQFRIDSDCDANAQNDSEQISANPGLDQNHDGILDSCQGFTPSCPCDMDNSGSLGVQDIFTFLGEFFAGTPAADFDASGNVSVQDVFSFLACYFDPPAGC